MKSYLFVLISVASTVFLLGCGPSRAVLEGPKVAPKWKAVGRFESGIAIPTASMGSAYDNFGTTKDWIQSELKEEDVGVPDSTYVKNASELLLAYATDPFGPRTELAVAIGLPADLEFAYRKLGGGNSFGFRYQFLSGELLGAMGAYYSSQDYKLPSLVGKAQSLLGFSFTRKDYTFPIVLGKTLGKPDGFRGEWGVGLQYQYTINSYGFDSEAKQWIAEWLIDEATSDSTAAKEFFQSIPHTEVVTHSFGGQGNFRAGYKFVNLVVGLGIYYQAAGEFTLLDGSKFSPFGVTFQPMIGIEIRRF